MKFTLKTLKMEHIYITYSPLEINKILSMSDTAYIDFMLAIIEEQEVKEND